MRRFGLFLALISTLATGGCADYYYRMIGRPDWPHNNFGLYSRLGGQHGMTRLADSTVDAAAADPRLFRYFAKANLTRVKAQLADRLCVATGGPCVYTGYGLVDVHAPLAIDQTAFDAFLDNVRKAATANGVAADDQEELIGILQPMRNSIVSVRS